LGESSLCRKRGATRHLALSCGRCCYQLKLLRRRGLRRRRIAPLKANGGSLLQRGPLLQELLLQRKEMLPLLLLLSRRHDTCLLLSLAKRRRSCRQILGQLLLRRSLRNLFLLLLPPTT
jgi:hypothetical protein